MTARLYLFDDRVARGWEPFALTRPAGELLFGCLRQRERAERFWDARCSGHLSGDGLLGYREEGAPPTITLGEPDAGELRVLVSSRVVFAPEAPPDLDANAMDGPATLTVEGEVVGWVLPPGSPFPEEGVLLDPHRAGPSRPEIALEGRVIENIWHLVAENAGQLSLDIQSLHPRSDAFLPPGVHHVGRGLVSIARDVELEPGITLDTRGGPIRVEEGAVIRSLSRLEGPLYIGRGSLVLGGSVGRASVGPRCKVRGEIEDSIILGYSNKAHDGYLGHAYVGSWVNLGALTTNSDLKNNYGPVRVRTSSGEADTGLTKVGCFLGDHVKTGIGTLLNTGSIVGAGSNLFGGVMPPVYVPPFSWGTGSDLTDFRLDKFLEVAEVVMRRRDVELRPEDRAFLEGVWKRGLAQGRDDGSRGDG